MSTTASGAVLNDMPLPGALPVEHLCDLSVDLEPAQTIPTPVGARMTFVVRQGTLLGPRIRGEVLPGGGDWLMIGTDLIGRVDVRATLRTDDGALIHYESRGVVKVPPDGLERLASGQRLPFAETYVRTTPKFETSDERYAWLNELVVVAYNELAPDHIDYRMFRVL